MVRLALTFLVELEDDQEVRWHVFVVLDEYEFEESEARLLLFFKINSQQVPASALTLPRKETQTCTVWYWWY